MKLGGSRGGTPTKGFRPKEVSLDDFPQIRRVVHMQAERRRGSSSRVVTMLVVFSAVMLIGLWAAASSMNPRR
jgi:hypothetical protein